MSALEADDVDRRAVHDAPFRRDPAAQREALLRLVEDEVVVLLADRAVRAVMLDAQAARLQTILNLIQTREVPR